MKNTVSFFSFRFSNRQLLSKGVFDNIKHETESSEKIKNEEKLNIIGSLPPRIPSEEMERLNKHIAEMNADGWTIKTIQSIETGLYDKDFEFQEARYPCGGGYGYGWGYGSSFTEGVIIYWEKE